MALLAQAGTGAAGAAVPPLAIAQGVLGGIQTAASLSALHKLNKEGIPQFNGGSQLAQNEAMYKSAMDSGMPRAFMDAALNQNRNQTSGAYRYIQDASNGQLGNAFGRVAAMDRNTMGLKLGEMNAQYRTNMMNHLANTRAQLQSQNNMETNAARDYYLRKMAAYGGALQAGTHNLSTAIDYAKWPNTTQPAPGNQPLAVTPAVTPAAQPVVPAMTPYQPVGYGDDIVNGGFNPITLPNIGVTHPRTGMFPPLPGSIKAPKLTYP